jgi:sec-independent protein translocase protein TatC
MMTNIQNYLLEIKLRLIYVGVSTISTFLLCSTYQVEMIYIIGKPFIQLRQTFIFLELTEALSTLIQISTFFTIMCVTPLLMYHIWSFWIPSFYQSERGFTHFVFWFFIGLICSEILFTYLVLLPKICNFFIGFEIISQNGFETLDRPGVVHVEFAARIKSYVQWTIKMVTFLLLIFQIPVVFGFLYSKKIFHVHTFYMNRKILAIICLLTAAFFVPPDAIYQVVVSLFFFLVFETIIFIGLFYE